MCWIIFVLVEGDKHPDGLFSTTYCPSSSSSPAISRPAPQRPFTKVPSSTVASPTCGGPGVLGEKPTATPLTAAKYSSGPAAMKIAATGPCGGGSPIGLWGFGNATSSV